MKRTISLLLSLSILVVFSAFPAFSETADVSVTLDGKEIKCVGVNGDPALPLLIDGTTYLPVRAVSEALDVSVSWDNDTRSVFIGAAPEKAEASGTINIYIDGVKFTAKDVTGKVVEPINNAGSVYLPIRAIGTAFDKNVSWDNDTRTVVLTTPEFWTFEEGKLYAFINAASGKAISVTDSGLAAEDFLGRSYQIFTLNSSSPDGYYTVTALSNGKNLDAATAGTGIITSTASGADSQRFAFTGKGDGVRIYARSSKLPIEDSDGKIKQSEADGCDSQLWSVFEVVFTDEAEDTESDSSANDVAAGTGENSEYVDEVIRLVNEIRAEAGLNTLTTNDTVNEAADIRAKEIAQTFSHSRPDGSACFTVMDELDMEYLTAGENIAYGYRTPAAVVEGWMNSEGHRKNILDASFTSIGVGYNPDGHYWVQIFYSE